MTPIFHIADAFGEARACLPVASKTERVYVVATKASPATKKPVKRPATKTPAKKAAARPAPAKKATKSAPAKASKAVPAKAVSWGMFAVCLFAGLTMVTNVPFYSFKDMHMKKSVPFATLVLVALGIAAVNIDPPTVLFGAFVAYGLSGYVIYVWRKAKGQPTSMISTSTDEPDERGLHQ